MRGITSDNARSKVECTTVSLHDRYVDMKICRYMHICIYICTYPKPFWLKCAREQAGASGSKRRSLCISWLFARRLVRVPLWRFKQWQRAAVDEGAADLAAVNEGAADLAALDEGAAYLAQGDEGAADLAQWQVAKALPKSRPSDNCFPVLASACCAGFWLMLAPTRPTPVLNIHGSI